MDSNKPVLNAHNSTADPSTIRACMACSCMHDQPSITTTLYNVSSQREPHPHGIAVLQAGLDPREAIYVHKQTEALSGVLLKMPATQ